MDQPEQITAASPTPTPKSQQDGRSKIINLILAVVFSIVLGPIAFLLILIFAWGCGDDSCGPLASLILLSGFVFVVTGAFLPSSFFLARAFPKLKLISKPHFFLVILSLTILLLASLYGYVTDTIERKQTYDIAKQQGLAYKLNYLPERFKPEIRNVPNEFNMSRFYKGSLIEFRVIPTDRTTIEYECYLEAIQDKNRCSSYTINRVWEPLRLVHGDAFYVKSTYSPPSFCKIVWQLDDKTFVLSDGSCVISKEELIKMANSVEKVQ